MKRAIYNGPRDFAFEDVEEPKAGPNDAVIEIKYAGVCGSDVTAWTYDGSAVGIHAGNEFGHEFAGVITEVGSKVKDVKVGDRVWVNPETCKLAGKVACCECGGFSEKVLIENAKVNYNVYKLPDSVDFKEAALIEPFCVGIHGKNALQTKKSDKVLIFGAGPIGLCCLNALIGQGVKKVAVADVRDDRLKDAEAMGAIILNSADPKFMENVEEVFGTTMTPFGPAVDIDVFIDCAGVKPVMDTILKLAKYEARISVVAVYKETYEMPLMLVMAKRYTITGSCAYDHKDALEAIGLLEKKNTNIDKLITHMFAYDELEQALDTASNPESGALKVMIDYSI